ncbi:class I SAM-dependent DNA methyltransferase [Bacillus kwashiorkori]|uniref:class I SAM-dependent DNA methyltransferase n=1 Tax=Bacillus kwashiorkori TaxID=1522318 RepID=UPI000781541E|nr:class I SAM-dependent methyltransferase [Bacillus kwashiorkori]
MAYESFAYLYDQLMDEAPYDAWLTFFKTMQETHFSSCKNVLDLACGTGEMSIRLHEAGYNVTGVDLSEDMLAVASEKAITKGYNIPFFQQNMTNLQGFGQFDAVVIFCDSLNYLKDESEVISTFRSVFQVLKQGGLLLFDVHSLYKMNNLFPGKTFAYNGEEISYIWNSYRGELPNSVEHELTFFVLDEETNQYDRFEEVHFQRTYPIEQYYTWLTEAGFTLLNTAGDFLHMPPTQNHERIFFTVKK